MGFKFWFRCSSKPGYLYQMDIYSGRKQIPESNLGLGEEVVLQLTKDFECTVYSDNLFNSPKLIEKLFLKGIYGTGTVRANRKQMTKTKSSVPCPKVVKLYNSDMAGVDLMDQRIAAYRLDRKSSVRFHLRILFDLMDIVCVNSYLI